MYTIYFLRTQTSATSAYIRKYQPAHLLSRYGKHPAFVQSLPLFVSTGAACPTRTGPHGHVATSLLSTLVTPIRRGFMGASSIPPAQWGRHQHNGPLGALEGSLMRVPELAVCFSACVEWSTVYYPDFCGVKMLLIGWGIHTCVNPSLSLFQESR